MPASPQALHPAGSRCRERFDPALRQAVAVTVRRDSASQREDVGSPVSREHVLLIRCPAPSDAVSYAEFVGLCHQRLYDLAVANMFEAPVELLRQSRKRLE